MRAIEVSRTIEVPDDVEAAVEGRRITLKGAKGNKEFFIYLKKTEAPG